MSTKSPSLKPHYAKSSSVPKVKKISAETIKEMKSLIRQNREIEEKLKKTYGYIHE